MTDSERSQINEWIEKQFENENFIHCKILKAWMSLEACERRQKKYATKLIADAEGHLIPNPKITSCLKCEYMTTELRRLSFADIKSIMHSELEVIFNENWQEY